MRCPRPVVHSVVALMSVACSSMAMAQAAPAAPDFDAAMSALSFNPQTTDANLAGGRPNGMLDAEELALLAAILANPSLNLRATGGVDHATVRAAFQQARTSAGEDMKTLSATYPTAADVAAGYAMLGKVSLDAYSTMSSSFGAPMKGDYTLALQAGRFLAHDGDADGDGVTNKEEYDAHFRSGGRAAYLRAALDRSVATRGVAAPLAAAPVKKTVGIVLYPGFEVLDVYGPIEMWAYVPEFKLVIIAEKAGPVRSAQGVSTIAEYSFADAPKLDIVMVPGGNGTRAELQNPAMLAFLRKQHDGSEVTTSVCTGSALLAKAGILAGHKATTNKAFFSLAVEQDPTVDWIVKARWVDDGKVLTSSGVSAGTDMALGLIAKLYGIERARGLARSLEYQWNEDPNNDPFAIQRVPQVRRATP